MKTEVALPETVKPRLQLYVAQLETAQANLNQYLQGICDCLGLEGQWSLDAGRMLAVKIEEQQPEAEP